MEPEYLGSEQVTEEDRAYNESRFSEVRDAIFANPYQKVWGGEGEPALPRLNLLTVSVNLGTLFDRMTDLQCCHAVISHHAVIEPFVEFDSLARPQAPNLVFDLFEGFD
jgi:hypothetical protein